MQKLLGKASFATFTAIVGLGIPIVVRLRGELDLDAGVDANVDAQASFDLTGQMTAGAGYDSTLREPFYSIFTQTLKPSRQASVTGMGAAHATLTPVLTAFLYGVGGPELKLPAALTLTVKTDANPWWSADATLGAVTASLVAPKLGIDSGPTLTLIKPWTFWHDDAHGPFGGGGGGGASVSVTNPGDQTTTTGTNINLQIHASDTDGGTLAYSASGLPDGLQINPTSGLITGAPSASAVGSHPVTVTATDASGASNAAPFTWTITSGIPSVHATAIAAGAFHACALLQDGTIECWGDDNDGELGAGLPQLLSTSPVRVQNLSGAISLSGAGNDTCAIVAGGRVECWGWNPNAELGDGTDTGPETCRSGIVCSSTPVPVSGLSGAIAVGGNLDTGCAVISGGSLDCWGSDGLGQLGDGQPSGPSGTALSPVVVNGIANAVAVAPARYHTCALLTNGDVDCWGDYESGGSPPASTIPVRVADVSNARAIASGYEQTCALIADGTVTCWVTFPSQQGTPPTQVPGLSHATAITVGDGFACAILDDHTIKCWGSNGHGQLGDASKTDSATPVTVQGISNAVAITAGDGGHARALTADGKVFCWGENDVGQLGDGGQEDSSTPVEVSGL